MITQIMSSFTPYTVKIFVGFFLPPGYDVIAQAQSGTGKTATFAISILQQVDVEMKATQALVLAPTRELAQQVSGQNLGFCEDMLNCISFCFLLLVSLWVSWG